jgi:hypothetical protein
MVNAASSGKLTIMKNATDEYVQCFVVAASELTLDAGARPSRTATVESRDGQVVILGDGQVIAATASSEHGVLTELLQTMT